MVFLNVNRDTFFVYKYFLRITGVWPQDRGAKRSEIIFTLFVTCEVLHLLILLLDALGMCPVFKTHDVAFVLIPWTITMMVKKVSLRMNVRKMIRLIQFTIDDWTSTTNQEELEIMKAHDKFGSLALQVGPIIVWGSLIVHEVLHRLASDKFPFGLEATICYTNVIGTWIITVIILMVTFVSSATNHFGMLLFWSFSMHLASQNKILKKRFQEFLLIKDKKESREEFRRLVDRHNQFHEFGANLEDAFSPFVGLDIVTCQMIACCLACELGHTIKAKDVGHVFVILRNAAPTIFSLIGYYYAGDYVTASSEEIGEVVEQCNWYELSKDSLTKFGIVIARTRKPTILKLWKIQQLNLSNLKNTLDALYSYVSLIVGVSMK